MSSCRVTQEFLDVVNPANVELRDACGYDIPHAWGLANFYGCGTMVLYLIPPTWFIYEQHREAFDAFWGALRDAGFLMEEPQETKDSFAVKGKRKGEYRFCLSCKIKNLEYIKD